MQDRFSLTTRRAAEIAGVERHVLLTSLQRHGHWRGVAPRKQPNGRLLWPAVAVYEALGKLSALPVRSPAARLRQRLCERAPNADPFHVQAACDALLTESPDGDTPRQRFDSVLRDLADLEAHMQAVSARIGAVLCDEERMTPDGWQAFNEAAVRIEHAAALVCTPLRWRSPAKEAQQ